MRKFFLRLLIEEDGPTAVEYGVLLALIVAACIGAVNSMASSAATSFGNSATQISTAFGS